MWTLVVNISLSEVTAEDGPFEIVPATQTTDLGAVARAVSSTPIRFPRRPIPVVCSLIRNAERIVAWPARSQDWSTGLRRRSGRAGARNPSTATDPKQEGRCHDPRPTDRTPGHPRKYKSNPLLRFMFREVSNRLVCVFSHVPPTHARRLPTSSSLRRSSTPGGSDRTVCNHNQPAMHHHAVWLLGTLADDCCGPGTQR